MKITAADAWLNASRPGLAEAGALKYEAPQTNRELIAGLYSSSGRGLRLTAMFEYAC